jgi:hypothetical protein
LKKKHGNSGFTLRALVMKGQQNKKKKNNCCATLVITRKKKKNGGLHSPLFPSLDTVVCVFARVYQSLRGASSYQQERTMAEARNKKKSLRKQAISRKKKREQR